MNKFPFIFGKPVSGDDFIDREEETRILKANFTYGINTIIISPRRMGKTSLVKKVCDEISHKQRNIVFMDIFSCRNQADFARMFADSIFRQTANKMEEWIHNARTLLGHLNPQINISPDLSYQLSFSLSHKDGDEWLEDIIALPQKIAEKKKCPVIICIDEFQQIGEFEDSLSFQKKLRTYWQHQPDVIYCLFGSKRHMMNEMFHSAGHPFYKFGEIINLKKIPQDYWEKYIIEKFEKLGIKLDLGIARKICEITDNYSAYVQQLASLVLINYDEQDVEGSLKRAYEMLLDHCSDLFEQQTQNLTTLQLNFLKAMIKGNGLEMTSKKTLERFELGGPSNVQRVRESLIKKEIIDIKDRKVFFADPILKHWLVRMFGNVN